jgi:hypothetical protein
LLAEAIDVLHNSHTAARRYLLITCRTWTQSPSAAPFLLSIFHTLSVKFLYNLFKKLRKLMHVMPGQYYAIIPEKKKITLNL